MNKILVTGANGFVGTSLSETLRNRGISFTSAVRRMTKDFQVAVGDLTENTDWSGALSDCGAVVHLAARVHVMDDKSNDPLAAFRAVNVEATLNLARQAALAGVKRFVFVSSVKVNGEETSGEPFTAFDQPMPLDPYGQSKLETEIALRVLASTTDLEIVIVRPPLVYGPGVGANFFRLMQLVKLGVPLPLGAICNRRSMVSVENLVDLLIVCCNHPDAVGQTFMVSDDCDVSIPILLRMLSGAMGKKILLFPVPSKIIYGCSALIGKSAAANRLIGSLQVDIGHTKNVLKWSPPAALEKSLQKTVTHFLNNIN